MMDIDKAFDEFIEFPDGSNGKYVTTASAKFFADYCVEKLQDENSRLLFANRYNADMYRQIDDERKRLQAEVERLKATLQQFMALNQHDRDLPLELFAIQRSVSAKAVSLANHDADVIERVLELIGYPCSRYKDFGVDYVMGFNSACEMISQQAKQLRQQTKEVQL